MRTELDPQLAAVVEDVEREGLPQWHAMSVESARRIEDEVFSGGASPPVDAVRDFAILGPGGDLPVRVYRPDVDEDGAPVLVYYHGGGWTLGTLDSIDGVCRRLARRAGCVVVSVDYRLAPDHPFPAAVDDAFAAVEWVAEHAATVGGDPDCVAVGGTSAGGNLAAATALRAREAGGPALRAQVLLYPMLDRDFERSSYEENADGPLLSRADVEWFWDLYLRSPVDGYNPFAAPLRALDLSGLPPTVVVTAGHDPLRDEGVAYAERLEADGVDVVHDHRPGMAHGFLSLTESVDKADAALDDVTAALRNRLD